MFSSLTGIINYKKDQKAEILVTGVGYSVTVPLTLMADLEIGAKFTLFTEMVVGEKLVELYGFGSREDVVTFKMLTSVSGVGPKTALQIFNQKESRQIRQAIDEADVDFFLDVKGLGKKTAQRLIVDLRSILDRMKLKKDKEKISKHQVVYDGLQQLGFSKEEIERIIPRIEKEKSDEAKISLALKLLADHEK